MITDLNKIADEWSYRVGTIKPKDFKHLYHLNQILYEYGWSHEVIENLNKKLTEDDDWWTKLSPEQQAQYIKDHPKSQKAQDAKEKEKGEKPEKEGGELNFKDERDQIVRGEKNPPGTGGSAIGEMYGGIALEEANENPDMTEEEFIDKHFDDVRNSPMSKGMSDKDIRVWLAVAHRTGQNEIKELKENKYYRFKEPQSPPYPIAVMDPVNEKGSSKKQLLDFFEKKLEEAKKSGNKKAIEHYERQLKFIKKRKDSDTGVLYETEEGEIGFKHTSNKKAFSDPVFNSTIVQRGQIMEESTKSVGSTYNHSEEQQQAVADTTKGISERGATLVERAALGPGESIRENVKDERKWSRRNRCGSLFKNFDGGAPGRKNYLNDIKSVMESNTGVGKKVNKWLEKNGIKPPYSDDDIAAAVIGLAKDGDNTGPIRKLVVKLSDNVKKSREVYNRLKTKYPDKSDDEIKQMTLDVLNGYKSRKGDDSPGSFDMDTLDAMLSEEMDWIENVGAETRDAMNAAHKQIVGELEDSDKKWREENPDTPPVPPENGPNGQAYIEAYMKQMHWDRYIHGDEEDIGDMSIDGYNVNSETIRGCLAKLSGYSGDVNSKEGRQKLFEHLRATLRPDAESGSISFNSKEGGDSVEIGKEQYRTKGVGNNSVMGNFGKDLQKCMKDKVTK